MFNDLPDNLKSLAQLCYDQCTIEEIKDDRDYPNPEVMYDFSVNELDWTIAHDAAIEEKENN